MPKLSFSVPKYRHHKASDQAIVTLDSVDYYLGPHGTQTSKHEYDRLVGIWQANGRRMPTTAILRQATLTVTELVNAYWVWAKQYYCKNGSPTSQQSIIKPALNYLCLSYGQSRAVDFGPLDLMAFQNLLVTHDLARTTINHYVRIVRSMYRWGVSHELVPPEIYQALSTVDGLRRGRTNAREPNPVKPVPVEHIHAVQAFVSKPVWAMIELQQITGMKSSEVINMRSVDINMSSDIWEYQPTTHKTEHHGHERIIALGPRCQAIIGEFLNPEPHSFLFSPKNAEQERKHQLSKNRKTKEQPSQRKRRKKALKRATLGKRRRAPKDHYTPASYRRAIQRACDQSHLPRWHPHQLRHNAATTIRRSMGLEAAQTMLGHVRADITQVYAERDQHLARQVAALTG